MTRREQLLAALPSTFPGLMVTLNLSRGNLSRLLADAMAEHAVHRVGRRRAYVYHPGAARPINSVWNFR